jgi:hypothetical protein
LHHNPSRRAFTKLGHSCSYQIIAGGGSDGGTWAGDGDLRRPFQPTGDYFAADLLQVQRTATINAIHD